MSDYLPFEIQYIILKKLPVKSLIQFRSVSKTWKSWIDSSDFVHTYTRQQSQVQHHVLVSYNAACYLDNATTRYKQTFISILDDDSFPLNRVSLNSLPRRSPVHNGLEVIGCSHGLLCFFSSTAFSYGLCGTAVIWNPCIRRAFQIDVPAPAPAPTRHSISIYHAVLGFGVCRVTNDPKIVKICYNVIVRESDDVLFQVDLFTLSTRAWRSLSGSNKLPHKSVRFNFLAKTTYPVVIDGFVYWLAIDEITSDDECCWLIVSFDTTSEEFGEVNLPNRLARSQYSLHMSKLRESLVLLEHVDDLDRSVYNVWMMEGGTGTGTGLFTQLYTFNVNTPGKVTVLGFRLRGDAIIEITDNGRTHTELVVYERLSKRINNLGFSGSCKLFSAHPYMETLFLHDHPDLTYNTEAIQDN